jgi:hypothetical protein
MAQETGRTLTEQTETLLQHGINGSPPVSPPSAGPQSAGLQPPTDAGQFSLQRLLTMLEAAFGPQIAGILCVLGYAMLAAELDSIAWSRDVAERMGPFPRVRARTGSAMRQRQIFELWDFLSRSSPAHKAEQSWLSDDSYVFGQVANAARTVLDQLAPEGDASPPRSPPGINRAEAVDIMKSFGEDGAYWAIDELTAEEPPGSLRRGILEPERRRALSEVGEADAARLKQFLGETAITRLRQWVWQHAPTEGQDG